MKEFPVIMMAGWSTIVGKRTKNETAKLLGPNQKHKKWRGEKRDFAFLGFGRKIE